MDKLFPFLLFFVNIWIPGCYHGFCDAAQTAKATASNHPETSVALSERVHPLDQRPHFCVQQDPRQAPFGGFSVHQAAQSSSSPACRHNGGIVAMQTMLESVEWQTRTLPTLWWTLGSLPRHQFCPTGATGRSTMESRPGSTVGSGQAEIAAWEKCTMARQSSLISTGEHTQSKKWIRTTTQAQTTWQEEAGQCIAAICGADYATSVECVLRPYKECAGGKRGSGDDCRGASRDDASPQDCIQRPDWNAGQRQEDGEEVRHQNNGAADQRDAPHKYIHWPSKETPSSTTRCQDQTQEVMAQAFGNSDVHPGEAV